MKVRLASIAVFVFVGLGVFYFGYDQPTDLTVKIENSDSQFDESAFSTDRETTQKDRASYFLRLLKNPETGEIPARIHEKERAFVEEMEKALPARLKSSNPPFEISEIGPNDVGGRTRALAMDSRDSDILLAGGVTGGIWKSTNGGQTWTKKTDINSFLGVMDLVQDPINPDNWYYVTGGEFVGSSPSATGAFYFGNGIFFSNDNGETWSQIANTEDSDIDFNSRFDFMTNMEISPTTGSIFFSTNGFSVYRSTDQLESAFRVVGGNSYEHIWSEVAVADNGTVIVVLSGPFGGINQTFDPGVYISTDDGDSWLDITPASFPNNADRSVIGTSKSDPDIFYILSETGAGATGLDLHYFDISDPNNVLTNNRSNGIPNFGDPVGDLDPQGGYNLVCKVHPSNSNIVFLGGTNLFRSTDGFLSIPPKDGDFTDIAEAPKYWIGGYDIANNISQYPQHHPDQHNLIFYPNGSNKAISAHDGGLSFTDNILSSSVLWEDIDDGYNVTQFYSVSIHPGDDDPRIGGGTQDNGSPYFLFDTESSPSNSVDGYSGDGGNLYIGSNYAVFAAQNGALLEREYSGTNLGGSFSYITPINAANRQFIHPYVVNPSNENYMFYADFDRLWRNDQLLTIPKNTSEPDGITDGWTRLDNVSTGTAIHEITAMAFSTNNPSNRLYFAGSDDSDNETLQLPVIKRLDDIDATDGEVAITIDNASPGSFVNNIAVNPDNGDELIVVMSNYDVKSIFYSSNAGDDWTEIGGNLEGENGPSIRSAAVVPTNEAGTVYFVGTSVGLFYTEQLDGNSTVWTRAAEDKIGSVIVSDLDYRRTDQILAIGTHGRGLFAAKMGVGVSNEIEAIDDNPADFKLTQNFPNPFNPSTNIEFSIPSSSSVTFTVFDIQGREVAKLYDAQQMAAGSYSINFDASSIASGTYIYRIEATPSAGGSPFVQSRTMTLIK